MHRICGLLLALLAAASVFAQQNIGRPLERYKVELNLRKYPQAKPEQALASVVKVINEGNLTYLMAQLADPVYVDAKVETYKKQLTMGTAEARTLVAFEMLVEQIDKHFRADPSLINELRKLAKQAQWDTGEDTAVARLPDNSPQRVYFKQVNGRWFLENRRK